MGQLDAETRERLGREVRDEWIAWAREQPAPKPSWLAPWEDLAEPDREVDRRIGERIYLLGFAAGRAAVEAAPCATCRGTVKAKRQTPAPGACALNLGCPCKGAGGDVVIALEQTAAEVHCSACHRECGAHVVKLSPPVIFGKGRGDIFLALCLACAGGVVAALELRGPGIE